MPFPAMPDCRFRKSIAHCPGLIRPDLEDELKAEEANREPLHVAVVMVGVNDRYNIRISVRDRFVVGTDEWREEYGRRVDRVVKTLKKRGAAVYWVGQPIMRRPDANEPAQVMNDVVREKAYLNGIKYIDITAQFADDAGNYTPYGPDLAGKQRLVREADGVLFSWAGYRKLAHFVEREIKRDLAQARSDRSIPLAGAETEQKRIVALRPRRTGRRLEEHRHCQQGGKDGNAAQARHRCGTTRIDVRRLRRAEGRQRPHLAQDHQPRRPRGDRDA